MIPITRLNELLIELKAYVNQRIDVTKLAYKSGYWVYDPLLPNTTGTTTGKMIDHILLSATEPHIIKKLTDKAGICLAVKMPDADSNIVSVDEYSEMNHQLFFVIEKVDPGNFSDQTEREHYAKMQHVMQLVKEFMLHHGLNGKNCGGDERLAKPFHTEWEYQTYGGFNGLSVTFDLEDFSL